VYNEVEIMPDRLVVNIYPKNAKEFHSILFNLGIVGRQLHHGLGRIESCFKACAMTFVALTDEEHKQEHRDYKWRKVMRETIYWLIKGNYVRNKGCKKMISEQCEWCKMPNEERNKNGGYNEDRDCQSGRFETSGIQSAKN